MSMILTTLSITSEGRDHYHPRVCSGKSLPIFFKPIKLGTPKLHEPSVHMDSETFCESCFFSSALCSCSYFLSSQLPGFSEGDIITTADGAERQQWISHNGSILHNVGPVVPPRSVLPAGTELPPRALVASPEQVAAANRRRKNTVPGRFVCNLCPQNFTAKHNLKNHINSHFQKKNHRCTAGCGSSFGTRSSLNRHRKKCKSVPST